MQISGRQAQRMGQQGLVTHMCGFLYGVLKTCWNWWVVWWVHSLPESAEAPGLPTLKMGSILAGE